MVARSAMIVSVLIGSILIDTVVAPAFAVAGWRPDVVVLGVVGFGLADGPGTGMRYGFAAGLAVDLLSSGDQLVGLSALLLLGIGYAAGQSRPYLTAAPVAGRVTVGAVSSALGVGGYGLLAKLLGVTAPTTGEILQAMLVIGGYGALLAVPALALVTRLSRRFPGAPRAPGHIGSQA